MRVYKISLRIKTFYFSCLISRLRLQERFLSDDEQSVTTESAVLGDLFQKYVAYIKLSFFLPQVFELQKFTSFSLLEGSLHGSVVTVVLHVSSVTLH
jgi:hypothetical protein